MSRKNKVHPDHYKVAGRLAPDDLARERMKQNARQDSNAWHERHVPSAASTVAAGVKPSDEIQAGAGGRVAARAPSRASRSAGPGRPAPGRPAPRSAKTQSTPKGGRTEKPVARAGTARAPRKTARKRMPGKRARRVNS